MPARAHHFVLSALLLTAAALMGTRAEGAEPPNPSCDRRLLPHNDARSVEAAARMLTGDKPQDVHVSEACIIGTTTSVTLTTPRGQMLCERLQSTWAKRGGWKCDAPEARRP